MAKSAPKQVEDSRAEYEASGPTFLAEQPANPKRDTAEATHDWAALRSHLEQRLVSLRAWRQTWWTQNWSDLAQFIAPERSIWLTQSAGGLPTPNNMTRGRPINTAIVDPTATQAARICSAGLVSGLASPSRPWFKLGPANRKIEVDTAGRLWLDEVEERIYTVCANSNFYPSFSVECKDLSVFGTAPVITYDDEQDVIRLYNPAVGEYYLASSATGRIDGLYRQFVQTTAQVVDFFGADNCPQNIQELWRQKGAGLEKEAIVAHAIEPNFGIGADKVGRIPGGYTWREAYWVYGGQNTKPLSLRGFIDCAFTAARWSTQSNDAYGRSVGMDVLPDVMQLQVMTRRMAEAIEKQVRPPLVGDMSLKNQPTSSLPGHITYVANLGPQTGIRPMYEVNPDLGAMTANIQAIQARIKTGFFNDLFLMLESIPTGKMTAYEVAAKMNEKMQVLGPVIENLLTESLRPKIKRIFGILKRRGLIDPPPPSLQGVPITIEFVSALALAQRAAASGGIERLVALVGQMAQFFPNVLDKIDSDVIIDEMNATLGNPQKIVRGPEQVEQMRQSKAEQAQQQNEMNQFSQIAEAAGKAAPAAAVLQKMAAPSGLPQ